jgi:hypothetical protein
VRRVRRRVLWPPGYKSGQEVPLLYMPRKQDQQLWYGRPHKPPYVRASWLEDLVWSDVRCFLEDPGEVLERVRKQLGSEDNATELEARRDELAKRLASRQAEKDRYVRTYAQGHISEEELDVNLADLKNQTNSLRLSP